jgi:ABC-2 type transport system permease protein
MTQAQATPAPAPAPDGAGMAPIHLPRRIELSAMAALFEMTVARMVRGRRLVVLALLFAMPAAIAGLIRYYNDSFQKAELVLVFGLVPQALVPLTALVLATGMIRDEIEEQTLTYLLIRPLPRWSVYTAKLLATVLVAWLVAAVFTVATFAVIHWGEPDPAATLRRALQTSALFGLSLLVYGAIFGCLSLVVRQSLALGVAYVIMIEGLFANIPFAVRKLTVMYYFRVLAERWLSLDFEVWSIDLDAAPSARDCLLVLLGAAVAATVLAAIVFTTREFRVKTPEPT